MSDDLKERLRASPHKCNDYTNTHYCPNCARKINGDLYLFAEALSRIEALEAELLRDKQFAIDPGQRPLVDAFLAAARDTALARAARAEEQLARMREALESAVRYAEFVCKAEGMPDHAATSRLTIHEVGGDLFVFDVKAARAALASADAEEKT